MPELQTLHVMPHIYRCGAFDCGVPSVNDALRGELLNAIREGRSRAYAVEETGRCIAFLALRAESFNLGDSIDRERYRISARRVPGVLLELIGVDNTVQGQGLGLQLVDAAIALTQQVAVRVAARFLALDSLPGAVGFYERQGFVRATTQPDRQTTLMILDIWEGA